MEIASIYDNDTGRIVMTVTAPDRETVLLQISDEARQSVLFGEQLNGREMYICEGEPTPRPTMPITISIDGIPVPIDAEIKAGVDTVLRIDGIVEGSSFTHPQGEITVDDGYVEWSAAMPGGYYFRIDNFPYKEVEINAVIG